MLVSICERCGTTNQKTAETAIDKLIVKVQNNGADNGSFTADMEACSACRQAVMGAIKDLLTSKVADITVSLKK